MSKYITIDGKRIGQDEKPYVIAEMSGNHNQSIDRAIKLVDIAAEAGADAIKLQTYTADTMTIDVSDGEFHIDDGGLWHNRSLYELYQEAYTPWEWHAQIFEHAKSKGITCFSSPFDTSAVDFLETLGAPAYKIASLELTDLDLVARAAKTGKPVIMSTGMATLSEIDEAVQTAREAGCRELVLLKCTSAYPAQPEDANLLSIPTLRRNFECQVGLSDHTMGTHIPIAAVALGATVIEKHFTTCRADGGVDAAFSLEPHELKDLVEHTRDAHLSIGKARFGTSSSEATAKNHRRSLYVVRDLKAGQVLKNEDVKAIRPGLGLPVKFRTKVVGLSLQHDVKRGTPLTWDIFK